MSLEGMVGFVKRLYVVPLLLLLLGLLVPLIYTAKPVWHAPPNPSKQTSTQVNNAEVEIKEKVGEIAAKASPHTRNGAGVQASPRHPAGEKSGQPTKAVPTQKKAAEETSEGASGGKPEPAAGAVVVGVAVVGKDGELLFGPAEVEIAKESTWGATALGALEATGLPYTMSARFPDLVEAIAGQRNRGLSGWMYKVNEEVPMVAAAKKRVQQGDRVIWWYSQDMNQAPPRWEELVKRS